MMPRNRIADVALLALAIAVLAVLSLRASLSQAPQSSPSTYDTGANGYAAVYALLAREGVAVDRFEQPFSQLFAARGTLLVAGDDALARMAVSREQRSALDAWVRRGGTLAIFGRVPRAAAAALALPRLAPLNAVRARAGCGLTARGITAAARFTQGAAVACTHTRSTLLRAGTRAVALAYRRGRGTVVFATTPALLDNAHLALQGNAAFAYAALSNHGIVAFEERIYGHASGRSFWQVLPLPMRVGVIIACVAALLAIAGENVPFAPAHIPAGAQERDSSEYVASLARMLERARARRGVIDRLCGWVVHAAAPRAKEDAHARDLLEQAAKLRALPHPGTPDLLAAGRLFVRTRKEYEW